MSRSRIWVLAIALSLAACGGIRGEDADAVAVELGTAKAALEEAIQKANMALADSLETKIKEVAATGDLDSVKKLIAEKEAFEGEGKVPPLAT